MSKDYICGFCHRPVKICGDGEELAAVRYGQDDFGWEPHSEVCQAAAEKETAEAETSAVHKTNLHNSK